LTHQAAQLQPIINGPRFLPSLALPGAGIVGLVPPPGVIWILPIYRPAKPGDPCVLVGVLNIENTGTPGLPIWLKARLAEQFEHFWMRNGYTPLIVCPPKSQERILPPPPPSNHRPEIAQHQHVGQGISISYSYTVEYVRPTDPPRNSGLSTSSHPRTPVSRPVVSKPAFGATPEDRPETIQPRIPLPAPNNTNDHTIAHTDDSQRSVCSQSFVDTTKPILPPIPGGPTPLSAEELNAPVVAGITLRTTEWVNHIDREYFIRRPNSPTDSDVDRMLALPAEQFAPDVELEVLHTVAGAPPMDAYPNPTPSPRWNN
jgi:hypothetical protein